MLWATLTTAAHPGQRSIFTTLRQTVMEKLSMQGQTLSVALRPCGYLVRHTLAPIDLLVNPVKRLQLREPQNLSLVGGYKKLHSLEK